MTRTLLVVLLLVGGVLVGPAGTPAATAAQGPTVVEPPTVTGTPAYGEVLRADPGTWDPDGVTFTYRWLRDGEAVPGADRRRHRPARGDIGHLLAVQVTATDGVDRGTAVSDPVRVTEGTLVSTRAPRVTGQRRFDHVLVADRGRWSHTPSRVRYQWLRDGREVAGATGRRHRLGVADFGHRMAVRVTVRRPGFRASTAESARTVRVRHRVPPRHRVTYHVETRGRIVADLAVFRKQAQQTFDDPRGWRGAGVVFRRVAAGGRFTLVLSEASQVPSFSPLCSVRWSCRVGRYVIINQTRWRTASPMWHAEGEPRRGYRHMVVDHEVGHWLGHGHRGCPGRGRPAPVMQTQSKGLDGCRPNPWPVAGELRVPRYS